MGVFTAGAVGVDFDLLDFGPLATAPMSGATPTSLGLAIGGVTTLLFGSGFAFAASGPPTGGVIERIVVAADVGTVYDISSIAVPAATFRGWVIAGDNASAKAGIFAGADAMTGSGLDDRLRAYAGSDTVNGGGGADFL